MHFHRQLRNRRACPGFTLAELLIALAILGVIATFTIPKVLTSQTDTKYNAMAKEAASMVSGAYQAYVNENGYSTATSMTDLTPYFNYVSVYTGTIDDSPTQTTHNCGSATFDCYKLHNGAVIVINETMYFNGTTTLNALPFKLDPDGINSGYTQGPGKSLALFLFYNGRISDRGNIPTGTTNNATTYNPDSTLVPSWFTWN